MKYLVFVLALSVVSCTHAPPTLSPEASQAFNKTRAIKGLDLLRDTAITANDQHPPLLSTDTTRTVVTAHRSLLLIIQASGAGWAAATEQGLTELATNLSPPERTILGPYIALVDTILVEATK